VKLVVSPQGQAELEALIDATGVRTVVRVLAAGHIHRYRKVGKFWRCRTCPTVRIH
jgi:hypothetical protein